MLRATPRECLVILALPARRHSGDGGYCWRRLTRFRAALLIGCPHRPMKATDNAQHSRVRVSSNRWREHSHFSAQSAAKKGGQSPSGRPFRRGRATGRSRGTKATLMRVRAFQSPLHRGTAPCAERNVFGHAPVLPSRPLLPLAPSARPAIRVALSGSRLGVVRTARTGPQVLLAYVQRLG